MARKKWFYFTANMADADGTTVPALLSTNDAITAEHLRTEPTFAALWQPVTRTQYYSIRDGMPAPTRHVTVKLSEPLTTQPAPIPVIEAA